MIHALRNVRHRTLQWWLAGTGALTLGLISPMTALALLDGDLGRAAAIFFLGGALVHYAILMLLFLVAVVTLTASDAAARRR